MSLQKPALMLLGTGSNVGKSMIVAGLCRAFARRGLAVAPFKPQNMSNNAAVTEDGGEIGRAQALQARAAGLEPSVHMNPVLLKPETDTGAQVIVRGQRLGSAKAVEYARLKPELLGAVRESFAKLSERTELIVVEGAGSPAEINLRAGDIANMGFARAEEVPGVLIGDIDRGGVIAQIVGTRTVIDDADAELIRGFLINKFLGDPRLFDDGYKAIEERCGWPGLGVIPWFADAAKLPAEDAVEIRSAGSGRLRIAVPQLSRIANFDDLDPLKIEPEVSVEIIAPGKPLPGDADLVILAGTKATIGDLAFLRAQGWDIDIAAHLRRGGHVLGLCGGYQMLGRRIADPEGIEGAPGETEGLGFLDMTTIMRPEKRLARVKGRHRPSGAPVSGYEIHIGESTGPDCAERAWLEVEGRPEGAADPTGRVRGTYLHGIFSSDRFRAAFLAELGSAACGPAYEATVEATLDRLAEHLEAHVDMDGLLNIARSRLRR